jgi:hypothetical protein
VLLGPFYLNDVMLAPNLVQSLISVHHFTTDNSCSMEFDPFDLSVKDLATRRVLVRYDSTDPLYTLPLSYLEHPYPTCCPIRPGCCCFLRHLISSPWPPQPRCPLQDIKQLSYHLPSRQRRFLVPCLPAWSARQLPFSSSSSRAIQPFALVHCDLWTSLVPSVSGYKYYWVILDDYTHYSWTFPLRQKSDTFLTLSYFFAFVSTQFGRTI